MLYLGGPLAHCGQHLPWRDAPTVPAFEGDHVTCEIHVKGGRVFRSYSDEQQSRGYGASQTNILENLSLRFGVPHGIFALFSNPGVFLLSLPFQDV
jgi:hypothetical protein